MNYIHEAQQVLKEEASALDKLACSLDNNFNNIINCILNINGRIAVTGMGKSGHVARKVAATLSSTGTPAYFIHPAEASHGDLGMMTSDDAVIIISNSGNTVELTDIIIYASKNRMPIIGITKDKDSFLGKHSDYVILQPQIHEACPLDCAPTTSTTVQMALGDALAMCLMSAHGFTKDYFHQYNPVGTLGEKLLLVKDVMIKGEKIPLVDKNENIMNVLLTMTDKSIGCAGVMDKEKFVGMITDGDIRRNVDKNLLNKQAKDIMTCNPIIFTPEMMREKALSILINKNISSAFVIDSDKVVGVVTGHILKGAKV